MPESAPVSKADLMLMEDMGSFFDDPLGFVMYAYDWNSDRTIQIVKLEAPWKYIYNCEYGPDAWACELLDKIGVQVRANKFDAMNPIPVDAIREAIASGHGIGKSALVAWIVDWIMSTRPHSKGTITANTAEQLQNKTWAEIAKWTTKCLTGHWFEVTTGRGSMNMKHKGHPDTWRCSAQTCREENSESFAGQHAPTGTSFYLFDEASAVPDKIKEVSEGGLTDGEPMMFAFGNPTRNVGWFYDIFHGQAHRWGHKQIDSRTVQITNKDRLAEWIKDYGIDSDFVKVRIRGMFPAMSAKQLISLTDIDAAFGRHLSITQYNFAPKIISVDPAWEGDDELVIGLRQGLKFDIKRVIPKNDNDIEIANIIMRLEDEEQADAVFIDGGYGTGIISAGRTLGRDWQIVWFAGKSANPGCLNKRAEMWVATRDWLKAGGSMPPDVKMHRDLSAMETLPRMDGLIQLASKQDTKELIGWSPGRGDCLAISFAYPVLKRDRGALLPGQGMGANRNREHDPLANLLS